MPTIFDSLPPLQRVTIYLDGDGWMLEHKDDPSAPTVLALFSTTVLPMPYLRATRESLVRDALERLHPGVVITRGDDVPCSEHVGPIIQPCVHCGADWLRHKW